MLFGLACFRAFGSRHYTLDGPVDAPELHHRRSNDSRNPEVGNVPLASIVGVVH
ncbi:MAG: hypothetical protein J0L92_26275 [Deltaproteobacteria bacterium]|nr:hypothetical protein [Deltaproteobacteria bacterium]